MFINYCKICGISKETETSTIFYPLFDKNDETDEIYYTKAGTMFVEYIFEEVYPKLNYPELICEICQNKLLEFTELRKLAIATHSHITELLKECQETNKNENDTENDTEEEEVIEIDKENKNENEANKSAEELLNVLEDREEYFDMDNDNIIYCLGTSEHDIENMDQYDVHSEGDVINMETLSNTVKEETSIDDSINIDYDSDAIDNIENIENSFDSITAYEINDNKRSPTDHIDSNVKRKKLIRCEICLIVFDKLSLLEEHKMNEHDFDGDNNLGFIHLSPRSTELEEIHIKKDHSIIESAEEFNNDDKDDIIEYDPLLNEFDMDNYDNSSDSKSLNEYTPKVDVSQTILTSGKYPCPICHRLYGYKRNLYAHFKKSHKVEPTTDPDKSSLASKTSEKYKCEICDSSFMYKRDLSAHSEIHPPPQKTQPATKPRNVDGMFPCTICDNVYKYKRGLNSHLVKTHGYPKRPCYILGSEKIYRKPPNPKFVSTIDKSKCPICKRILNSKNLDVHLLTHNRPPRKRPPKPKTFVCTTCGKKFINLSILHEHEFRHKDERPLKCEICDKYFKMTKDLEMHNRIHTGEKRYVCDICGKSFYVSRQLEFHKETHSTVPLYECTICLRKLKTRNTWESHMAQMHKKSGQYLCGICNQQYSYRNSLLNHFKVHIRAGDLKQDQIDNYIKYVEMK